jgi:hypothetical protein
MSNIQKKQAEITRIENRIAQLENGGVRFDQVIYHQNLKRDLERAKAELERMQNSNISAAAAGKRRTKRRKTKKNKALSKA